MAPDEIPPKLQEFVDLDGCADQDLCTRWLDGS
jgi:hypothetical protein